MNKKWGYICDKKSQIYPLNRQGKGSLLLPCPKCRLASFYLYENPNFKKVRKTAKNEENPRKSRFFRLASFLSRRIGGATRKSALRGAPAGVPNRIPRAPRRAEPSPIEGERQQKAQDTAWCPVLFGGATRNRTGDEGFADLCLTAWLWRRIMERITGLEPATSTLARWRSTK